ncbi:MAG: DUF1385 domain-containing protein [Candidatus Woesearchaeota archaeon]
MENIGGQAVIEGVMIRGPKAYSIALRKPNGKIKVKKVRHISLLKRNKIVSLPFIRGVFVLFESIAIGMKALNYSASVSGEEQGVELKGWHLFLTIVLAVVFGLLLFKALPLAVAQGLGWLIPVFGNLFLFNIAEGLVKVMVLFAYILLISRMKDVKRLFQYHGAEHKVVNCYEAGKKLAFRNIAKFSTIHPRCGSSFMLLVLVVSIVFYMLIPLQINYFAKLGVRILLLPLIGGVTYEIIKLGSKYKDSWLSSALLWPGAMVQKLTTSEPDKKQIEVAIKAVEKVSEKN